MTACDLKKTQQPKF